jgi:hypothetical protein
MSTADEQIPDGKHPHINAKVTVEMRIDDASMLDLVQQNVVSSPP